MKQMKKDVVYQSIQDVSSCSCDDLRPYDALKESRNGLMPYGNVVYKHIVQKPPLIHGSSVAISVSHKTFLRSK